MRNTGISTIDRAPQVAAAWLNELHDTLGWRDQGRTQLLLRTTLHTVRDFLTVEEAADVAAQLPLLIRGIYYDGWVPSRAPAKSHTVDEFLDRVMEPFGDDPPSQPEVAVAAVFDLLRRHIEVGEFEQVTHVMQKPSRDLWM